MSEKFKLRKFTSISGLCLGNISQVTMSTTNVGDTKGNAALSLGGLVGTSSEVMPVGLEGSWQCLEQLRSLILLDLLSRGGE